MAMIFYCHVSNIVGNDYCSYFIFSMYIFAYTFFYYCIYTFYQYILLHIIQDFFALRTPGCPIMDKPDLLKAINIKCTQLLQFSTEPNHSLIQDRCVSGQRHLATRIKVKIFCNICFAVNYYISNLVIDPVVTQWHKDAMVVGLLPFGEINYYLLIFSLLEEERRLCKQGKA